MPVVEFRERQPDRPTTLRGRGPEFDYGETGAVCDVCGYWGIIPNVPEFVNASSDPDRTLSCSVCGVEE